MQDPLGAAFARKVLRRKARDEGRTLVLFDEERNAAAGHFSCNPCGAVLGGAICFVASLANSPAIRLRLASRISPRQAAPRPHGVLHQPAKRGSFQSTCPHSACFRAPTIAAPECPPFPAVVACARANETFLPSRRPSSDFSSA